MLSFLQGLGKRSQHMPTSMLGLDSLESIPSRSGTRNASDSFSKTPSLTPPTSNTDAGSISTSTDVPAMSGAQEWKSGRLRHVRSSIGSYNENVLSGSARQSLRQKKEDSGRQMISGNTLIDSSDGGQNSSVPNNMNSLSPGSIFGPLLGENTTRPAKEIITKPRRESTRKIVVERANHIAKTTRSVLEKRGRETKEAGTDTMENTAGGSKNSLQSGHNKVPPFEGPSKKRAQHLDTSDSTMFAPATASERMSNKRPKVKRWLEQGLYVGQDRDFDPRLTETKNKLKRLSEKRSQTEHRAIVPMPMFAGQRTLEIGRNFRLPFDIFSPLPPGQPRPEEWKKTHKNVFIGDAASVWKKTKRLESSRCVCTPANGCDENCFNRFMFYECENTNCNIGADFCTNRSFESLRQRTKAGGKYNVGVEVIKTLDRGHGVRSNRSFNPNEIIVEYTGEIITRDECEDRMNKRYKDSECYYLMDFDQHMILDATRGSIARFINHSCEPNCKMIKWTVAGKPRMALFAGDQGVMTGDELTYDYNFNPYSIKNVQECRCGAPSCRGVLGPKPKEIRDALKPLIAGGKRKIQQTLENSFETVTKKRKLGVSSSAKNIVATGAVKASKKLKKGQTPKSSILNRREKTVKVSTESSNGNTRTRIVQRAVNRVKRNTTITYSSSRRSSLGTPKTKEEGNFSTKDRLLLNDRKNNLKSKAAISMREDLAQTTKWSSSSRHRTRSSGIARRIIKVINE